MDALLQFQLDLAAKIASEPYFNYIAVTTYRSMVIAKEVAKLLPWIAGKNGKLGCGVVVNMPTVSNTYANIDPPVSEMEISADIIEQPELNFLGAGTQLTCEEVARQVRMTFNLFIPGLPNASTLYAPDAAPVLIPIPDIHLVYPNCCGYRVIGKIRLRETQQTRTVQPALSSNGYTITLADQEPGGGSAIYFTIDGSFPGTGNTQGANGASSATLYTAPFTIAAGVTVRFAAYAAGSLGSNVGCYIDT